MATTITMPKLGLTMNSGSVQEWKKKVGDTVKKGELLYTVATDKLTVDVESPADGVLGAITVEIGQEVPVGAPLGVIVAPGEAVPVAKQEQEPAASQLIAQPAAQAAAVAQPTAQPSMHYKASPKAKKLARESGVDLSLVPGTGPDGWVVARDVEAAAAAGAAAGEKVKASPVAAKMAAEGGVDLSSIDTGGKRVMKADVEAAIKGAEAAIAMGSEKAAARENRVPATQMRKVVASRMLQSTSSIPSVHYFMDVDMGPINALRAKYNDALAKRGGKVKISLNDVLMKFCASLLMQFPMVNAYAETDSAGKVSAFITHDYVNVGLAVALDGGLIVPNVKDVQAKGLAKIAEERDDLVARARKGALTGDEMAGGTFTISNLGAPGRGVDSFTPIINPPEAAILGIARTIDKPVVVDGSIKICPMAAFCLAADHRLVDGADAAMFLSRLKELVENPDLFLL
ncbi:MAG: 2-oxo acid dehydrogenase subunit E2 [Synergistaceae bacterium]|jgi:pyruvate dehydrogenase E2 component (dihydrolipoamide acetyltransferase)|nr:2-oxo acid dehydrogenase subunit E2 [Synergistaceae bacterium]